MLKKILRGLLLPLCLLCLWQIACSVKAAALTADNSQRQRQSTRQSEAKKDTPEADRQMCKQHAARQQLDRLTRHGR